MGRRVIATSVIRAAEKGGSHGGVYTIDLNSGKYEKVIDWSDPNIKWDGRGGERGLRGITFHNDRLYIATSEAICCFNKSFQQVDIYHSDKLRQCHEICTHKGKIYITSTSFNMIVEFDPVSKEFTRCLDNLPHNKTFHLNNIFSDGEKLYFSGSGYRSLWVLNNKASGFAAIQGGTHNVQPYKEGILYNHTRQNSIVYATHKGKIIEHFNIKQYDKKYFINGDLPDEVARTGFGRGLCTTDDYIIGGSSPANISIYRHGDPNPIDTIFLSKDVRNAIHGLEVLPEGW